MSLKDYIEQLQAAGQLWFTLNNAVVAMNVSRNACLSAIKRLKQQGVISSPARNFYIIIPPEHKKLGCIPAEQFIPHLMKLWNVDYYACLLTAAEYHGAAHQRPQRYQVMTTAYRRDVKCGSVCVQFIQKKKINNIPVTKVNTPYSIVCVSSPEMTALDLVMYQRLSGGLHHVATVLTELVEVMNAKDLKNVAEKIATTSCLQRLGFILEYLDENALSQAIYAVLCQRNFQYIPLSSKHKIEKTQRNDQWKLYINIKIEADL